MALRTLISHFRRLGADERGASLVEFAFFVPVLALFVLGIIDLSQGLAQRMSMQQAVNRGLELMLVQPPSAGANATAVDYTPIRQEAATAAGVPIDQVRLDEFLLCDGTLAAVGATCATGQDSARYVELVVNANFIGTFYVGTIPLSATGAMRIQ
jgi:hypothetical protein